MNRKAREMSTLAALSNVLYALSALSLLFSVVTLTFPAIGGVVLSTAVAIGCGLLMAYFYQSLHREYLRREWA